MEAIVDSCASTPFSTIHRYPSSSCRDTRKFFCRCSAREAPPGNILKQLSYTVSRRRFTDSLVALILLSSGRDLGSSSSLTRAQGPGLTDKEKLESIQLELRKVLKRPKAAGVLRLVFHDAGTFNAKAQTGGMNGSILYELDRPENSGLERSIKILDTVKTSLDTPSQGLQTYISWADLIAVAGAEAVAICYGPTIPIKLGRLDTVVEDPEGELPAESFNASTLKSSFLKKGFMTRELVVLSGAHTLGGKGFGNPLVFDNAYFKVLLQKPWTQTGNELGSMTGLPSDRMLVDDEECLRWIHYYASDQAKFFEDFCAAYVKLVDSGVKWRTEAA